MTKLVWGVAGEKYYETGVSSCALYIRNASGEYPLGVAWNGIQSATETPEGAETEKLYADNEVYLSMVSKETLKGSIEAYMYPDEFEACQGYAEAIAGMQVAQQNRSSFGLAFKTKVGNDTEGEEHGYKIHLWYNCKAAPSERAYATVGESPDAMSLSWDITLDPEPMTGQSPTSLIVVDSTKSTTTGLAALEDALFGTETPTDPYLPLPDAVKTLLETV
jgi:hypothetical protein